MLIVLPFTWAGGAEATPNAKQKGAAGPSDIYFRCMTATLASFRRWHPDARLVLAVDVAPPHPFDEQLRQLGVTTRLGTFAHRPPAGFPPRFVTSLYLLDALRSGRAVPGWDRLVVIDPDLFCMEPLDRLLSALDRTPGSVGAMLIDYPVEHDMNGLTRREAAGMATYLDGAAAPVAPHYGGKFLVVPRDRLDPLLDRAERAWTDALERFRSRTPHFVTEEHLFSYARRDLEVTDLSPSTGASERCRVTGPFLAMSTSSRCGTCRRRIAAGSRHCTPPPRIPTRGGGPRTATGSGRRSAPPSASHGGARVGWPTTSHAAPPHGSGARAGGRSVRPVGISNSADAWPGRAQSPIAA